MRQMEDECTRDNKHAGDELQINKKHYKRTHSTYMQSDSINYKSLIEI